MTGKVPFPGAGAMEILRSVVKDPTPRARTFDPSVSEPMDRLLYKMMHRNPRKRFQRAEEAQRAFLQLQQTGDVSGSISSTGVTDTIRQRVRGWWQALRGR